SVTQVVPDHEWPGPQSGGGSVGSVGAVGSVGGGAPVGLSPGWHSAPENLPTPQQTPVSAPSETGTHSEVPRAIRQPASQPYSIGPRPLRSGRSMDQVVFWSFLDSH